MGCCEFFMLKAQDTKKQKSKDNNEDLNKKEEKNKADAIILDVEKNTDRRLMPNYPCRLSSKPSQKSESTAKSDDEEPQMSFCPKEYSEGEAPTDTEPDVTSPQNSIKRIAQIHSRFFKQLPLSIIEQNSSKMEAGSSITNAQPQNKSHIYAAQASIQLKNIQIQETLAIDEVSSAENRYEEPVSRENSA